jgi:hypothetical protein
MISNYKIGIANEHREPAWWCADNGGLISAICGWSMVFYDAADKPTINKRPRVIIP